NWTLQLRRDLGPLGVHLPLTDGAAPQGWPIAIVTPFEDRRPLRDRCGMRHALRIEAGQLRCSEEPGQWLAGLLRVQLERAGFKVQVRPRAPLEEGSLRIEGALTRFFVEPVHVATAPVIETDLQASLTVRSADGLVAERTFFAKGRHA